MAVKFARTQFVCLLIALSMTSIAMAQRGRGGGGNPGGGNPGGGGPGGPGGLGGQGQQQMNQGNQANQPNQVDDFVLAQREYAAQQYLSARDLLVTFIGAAQADVRIPVAKKLLIDAYKAAADQLWAQGDFQDALATWADYAGQYKDTPDGPATIKLARQKAADEFAELMKEKKFRPAVQLADDYKTAFPDQPPLVDADVFEAACVEMLDQATTNKIDPQTLADLLDQVIADGIAETELTTKGISVWLIRVGAAGELLQHNELNKAIKSATALLTGCPPDITPKLEAIISQAMIARAEAYARFGNLPMLEQALTEMDTAPVGPAGKAAQTRLADVVKNKIGVVGNAAHVLKLDAPILHNGKWTDDGAGYTIDGNLTINSATINVQPGFVLEGGTISVQNGSLVIDGTPALPVIFRNVRIQVEMNASLTAKGAIFENCFFSKSGGAFSHYTSKWNFNDSLLVNSNFTALDGIDYGIHILNSVVVDCKIPSRLLFGNPQKIPGDAAKTYRDDGNEVSDDAFIHCDLAPSFAWTTQQCYFERSKVTATETWHSSTSLAIKVALAPDEMDFADRLRFNTRFAGQGIVTFSPAAVADAKAHSLLFFDYVGMGDNKK